MRREDAQHRSADAITRRLKSIADVVRLDLQRIEATLTTLQEKFDQISSAAGALRDPMGRHVIDNMLASYSYVEWLVSEDIDIFAIGHHKHLLELNCLVLCGTDTERRRTYAGHLAATERRFYEELDAGIEDVAEWYRSHAHQSAWDVAAGAYIQILSAPQLFSEGNHRTGALVISYILMRNGEPPFVMSVDNAIDFLAPSGAIRHIRKHSLAAFIRVPGIRARIARFLQRESAKHYLLPIETGARRQVPGAGIVLQ